jgi:hypothetical protein
MARTRQSPKNNSVETKWLTDASRKDARGLKLDSWARLSGYEATLDSCLKQFVVYSSSVVFISVITVAFCCRRFCNDTAGQTRTEIYFAGAMSGQPRIPGPER